MMACFDDPAADLTTLPFGKAMRSLWRLASDVAYLNHGGFGATPIPVLDAQARLRDRIEAAPGPFFTHDFPSLIRQAADRVAGRFGAAGDGLVFVDNATAGVNAVLASLRLAPGDEVLITNATYGGIRNAAAFATRRTGARLVEATLPFPPPCPGAVVDAIGRCIGRRTRLAIVDHVVSENGLVLPISDIVAGCRSQGVPVLVDGAHAPGHVAVDLAAIDADWYTANLHKWAFAPRSCGILWASAERRDGLHPAVISWGLDRGFAREFDWVGTRDPTPWLTAPVGLELLDRLGFDRLAAHNHQLVMRAQALLSARWDQAAVVVPDAMIGAMAVVPMPGRAAATQQEADAERLRLWRDHRIEAPIVLFGGRLWVRISAQIYNRLEDYERLAEAIPPSG